jgi:hypothetical protein
MDKIEMDSKEGRAMGLKVWWLTFGMDLVEVEELLENELIGGGFSWSRACEAGILRRDKGCYSLTPKAIEVIKEYDHGH